MNPRERTLHHARRLAIAAVTPAAVSMAFGCDPAPEPPTCSELVDQSWGTAANPSWADAEHSAIFVTFYAEYVSGEYALSTEVVVEGGTLLTAELNGSTLAVAVIPDAAEDTGATRTVKRTETASPTRRRLPWGPIRMTLTPTMTVSQTVKSNKQAQIP